MKVRNGSGELVELALCVTLPLTPTTTTQLLVNTWLKGNKKWVKRAVNKCQAWGHDVQSPRDGTCEGDTESYKIIKISIARYTQATVKPACVYLTNA